MVSLREIILAYKATFELCRELVPSPETIKKVSLNLLGGIRHILYEPLRIGLFILPFVLSSATGWYLDKVGFSRPVSALLSLVVLFFAFLFMVFPVAFIVLSRDTDSDFDLIEYFEEDQDPEVSE